MNKKNNDEIINIKELDLQQIRPTEESINSNLGGTKITIIGKPGTGKSVLIKHILYSKKHLIPTGIVISGSEDSNKFYSGIFPDCFIHEKYNKKIISNYIDRQKLAKEYLPKKAWSVLIMDDCMDDIKIFNDSLMCGLFKNGRHWNMLAIFANQYVFDFKPHIRTNIDGVFIFREPNRSNREKIYKNFASIIPSYSLFCDILDELTTDYTCIYIDNQNQSNNWQDCVFYFKADNNIKTFKFGCDEFINFKK